MVSVPIVRALHAFKQVEHVLGVPFHGRQVAALGGAPQFVGVDQKRVAILMQADYVAQVAGCVGG